MKYFLFALAAPLAVTALVIGTLRNLGLSQSYEHSTLSRIDRNIANKFSNLDYSNPMISLAKLPSKNIYLSLSRTSDGDFYHLPEETKQSLSLNQSNKKNVSKDELETQVKNLVTQGYLHPSRFIFLETLGPLQNRNTIDVVMIKLNINEKRIHTQFESHFEKSLLDESRMVIQSDYDLIIKNLKPLMPKALFVIPPGESTRFLSFTTLFLEPFIPIVGDIFLLGKRMPSKAAITELNRRKKLFFTDQSRMPSSTNSSVRMSGFLVH